MTGVEFIRQRWNQALPDLFPEDRGERTRVVITLRVDGRVRPLLRVDSPVEIDKNLTGNLNVLVREGSGGPLPAGEFYLLGSPGVDLNTIAARINAMLKQAEPAVGDLASLASRLASSGDIGAALKDGAGLLRDLREGMGPIQERLQAALSQAGSILEENRADLRSAASDLAQGAALARRVLEKVEPAAGGLGGAVSELERAAAAIGDAVESGRPGIDAIIADAREAMANAANVTADIRRRPWRLLYRPSRGEEETLDLYDAAWAYNLEASQLERCLRELTSVVSRDGPPPAGASTLKDALVRVEESLRRHREAEEAFFRKLKD